MSERDNPRTGPAPADPLDTLFASLRRQRPSRPFATPDEVRERGRVIAASRRRAVVAVTAACVVLAGVAGVLVAGAVTPEPARVVAATGTTSAPATGAPTAAGPSQVPATSSSPRTAVSTLSPGVTLAASDLGAGIWTDDSVELFDGGDDAWFFADACEGYRREDYPSRAQRIDYRATGYRNGDRTVLQLVEAFRPGVGPRSLGDVRAVIAFCRDRRAYQFELSGAGPTRYEIVQTGFAGDESMLVREEKYHYDGAALAPDPVVVYVAVARVGDQVTSVWCDGLPEDQVITVARRAVERL